MKLVICEKPSVGVSISSVLGVKSRHDGYIEGGGYIVSWCFGHLAELSDADAYDEKYGKWRREDLPILPDSWQYTVARDKQKQMNTLRTLMHREDVCEVINACDAGREGELIFRAVYYLSGCTKPMKRLWISSMEDSAIQTGFKNLRAGSEFDGLYQSALCRSKADWLVGINATRLFSILYHRKLNVGRVVSPTLALIVQRECEIDAFNPEKFYTVGLNFGNFEASSEKFSDKSEAEKIVRDCESKNATVRSIDRREKSEKPPMLFDLTTLQRTANKEFGYTAQQTLDYLQSLYEKKLCTYPRTDSRFLTNDMAATIPKLAGISAKVCGAEIPVSMNTSVVCDSPKVSDHHAILPTEYIDKAEKIELTKEEKAILDMVIRRFLVVLSQEYQYNETAVIFDVNGETFRCKYKVPVKLGWKRFYPGQDEDNGKAVNYTEGESFEAKDLTISECETQPPKHYTESTLLKAMENIDRRIEDKELSSYVSERGLGTPATRAAIIERIITVGYIKRSGKSLLAEEKGIKLIDILPENVKNIEMTASMEQQLAAIEKGSETAENVIAQTIQKVRDIITLEAGREHVSLAPLKISLGKCPKCGGSVYEFTKNGNTVYYCENSPAKCFFRLWADDKFFTTKGKKLTSSIVKSLLAKGKVKLSGLKSERTGATYDAIISFSDKDYKDAKGNLHSAFSMEFDNSKKQQKTKDKKKGG